MKSPSKSTRPSSKSYIWVAVLIPSKGADCYGGARVTAFKTQVEAYLDLYEWLDISDEDEDKSSKRNVIEMASQALDDAIDNYDIDFWQVAAVEL